MRTRSTTRTRPDSEQLREDGSEGAISFVLKRRRAVLFIERARHRRGKGRVVHAMRFRDEATFLRWCSADRLQFTYPRVHAQLKRAGCALLERTVDVESPAA